MKKKSHHPFRLRALITLLSAGIACLASSGLVSAQTVIETVNPDIRGSLNNTQNPGQNAANPGFNLSPRVRWGNDGGGSGEWQGWLKYTIPEVPGYFIESATINFFDIVNNASPGLVIQLVSNDWNAGTIYYERYNSGLNITLVTVGSHQANPSGNISTWFDGTVANIQPGDELSIKVFRNISGNRRAQTDGAIQLEITYAAIPEPSTYALIGGVLVMCLTIILRRRIRP